VIYTHVAAALAGAAIAGAGAWSVQGWRMGEQIASLKTEYATAQARAMEKAHADTIKLQAQADKAAEQHAARQTALANDAAGARDDLGRLRDTIANTAPVCVSSDSQASPGVHTDPARELFAQCAGTLADLAKAADGHAADKLMLLEAWPR
jgi:hypothetical protein